MMPKNVNKKESVLDNQFSRGQFEEELAYRIHGSAVK